MIDSRPHRGARQLQELVPAPQARAGHSFPFQLNLSTIGVCGRILPVASGTAQLN